MAAITKALELLSHAGIYAVASLLNRGIAFLLIPVGYAADDCQVPKKALSRKPLADVMHVV